ncbi:MAG: B12-binding domain-containing radical SAM protein [Lachnospiraceae bacterium]|nr:B12-binding domain-containing radical SAM protein [Lachnospiraceae bacterium]
MRYLLAAINAKYIHSNLGVYSLKAYADRAFGGSRPGRSACFAEPREAKPSDRTKQQENPVCPDIRIGEYTINHSRETILADLYRRQPDVIGFSCYIWNMEYVRSLLLDLPKILPNVRIWLGGPEVSYHATEILKEFPQVTGVMVGEGERTFAELVRFYEQGGCTGSVVRPDHVNGLDGGRIPKRDGEPSGLRLIPGIVYREEAGNNLVREEADQSLVREEAKQSLIRENPPMPLLDLSDIPFPYSGLEDFEHRIIYYESSRGCPFSCSYCLSSIDKTVRFRSLELVKRELQFFLDRKVPQVKFVDRTFNCKKSHAIAIWRYILEHDNGVTNFHFEISADLLDEEEVELMRRMRPGLIQLEIGVQTTNPNTIEAIRRRMDLEKVREWTAKVRSGRNIHQHLDLIAGLPYENLESFRHSFDEVYRMRPDQLQLGFLKVLKGSYMEEKTEEYQIAFTGRPPYEVLSTRWLSYGDVLRLKKIEDMVEVHYNSGQFGRTLALLETQYERPVQMFEALADWYEGQGLAELGHSRQARYEILFRFFEQHFPERLEEFRDCLTMDIYLRENAKSRPVFARDLSGYRQEVRRFYQTEEQERHFLKGYEGFDSRQLASMTHIEVLADGSALLFDYRNREALTHNAAVFKINGKEWSTP